MLATALAVKKKEIVSDPVKTRDGYFILQVLSTGESHPTDEEAAYAQASANCREEKAQLLIPQAIMELINKSKVVYHLD